MIKRVMQGLRCNRASRGQRMRQSAIFHPHHILPAVHARARPRKEGGREGVASHSLISAPGNCKDYVRCTYLTRRANGGTTGEKRNARIGLEFHLFRATASSDSAADHDGSFDPERSLGAQGC